MERICDNSKSPVPILPADVVETQEAECSRLALGCYALRDTKYLCPASAEKMRHSPLLVSR